MPQEELKDEAKPVEQPEEGDEHEEALEEGEEEGQEEGREEVVKEEVSKDDDGGDVLAQRARELELENAFLKGERARIRQQEEQKAKPPVEEDEDDDGLPAVEVLDSMLRAPDAAKHLRDVLKQERKRNRELLTRGTTQTREELQLARIRDQDEQTAVDNYPELQTSKEFRDYRDQVLTLMRNRNGGRYMRGDIITATAAAYGELLAAGLLEPRPRRGANGNGSKPAEAELRREIRKTGLTSERPPIGKHKDPFDGFSAADRRAALKTCKDMNVTPEQYRANYDAYMKEQEG